MLRPSYVSSPFIDDERSVTYAFGKNNAVIIADIDRNGYLDIVTFPSNFTVAITLSPVAWINQDGIFIADPSRIQNPGPYQYFRDSVAGDFNGDGLTDYFQIDTGWELNDRDPAFFFGSQPALLLGGATGLIWQSTQSWLTNPGGGQSFNHIADSADYDRDGDLDLVIGAFWDFRIYENNGNGTFTWREDILPAKFNSNTGQWDVSGTTFIELDGQYAIVAGSYRGWDANTAVHPLSILVQVDGQFQEAYTLARPNLGFQRERNYGASDMFNIDLNGDGREDLLVIWETEPLNGIDDGVSNMTGDPRATRYTDLSNTVVSMYFQDANGHLVADNTFYNGPRNTNGAPLYFEDFNLDGHADFWFSHYHARPTEFDKLVFINDGNGKFSNPVNMFNTTELFPEWYTLSPFFFDANNDGATDVVGLRGVFPNPPTRNIGEELQVFLSDSPAYNINGNNKFLTVLKDQLFDGGAGTDTAIFSGQFSDYTLSRNDQGHITFTDKILGRDGRDSFVNIERFKFDDGVIAIDFDDTSGQAYRLYTAALDREPDLEGLGFWIAALDRGASLQNVARGFVDSTEFRDNFYGDGSNGAFVTALYNNVLDRAPEPDGYNFWLGALNRGVDRAEILLGFSESPENYANAVKLTGSAVVYQEWLG